MTLLLIVTAIASLGEPLLVILAVIGVLYFLFKLLGCPYRSSLYYYRFTV